MDKKIVLPEEFRERLLERFLRYVQVDTQSSDNPAEDHITLPKQKAFLAMIANELHEIGGANVEQLDCGYVFATIPASDGVSETVPVLGYMAHADTYPGTPGANVRPQVIKVYNRLDIALPGTNGDAIKVVDNTDLFKYGGGTIITSDGTTLLGADDKAGIAEIVTIADYLMSHPKVKHGKIRICFTTNEEVGRGTEHFDEKMIQHFGAKYAHTFDGRAWGEVEDETFCADTAIVTIIGHDVHPGYAKGKMINAVRAAGSLVDHLDRDFLPETTEGREPFLHPMEISGNVNNAKITLIVRAFTMEELHEQEDSLRAIIARVKSEFPGVEINLEIKESYRNMKEVLDQHPMVMANAIEAIRRQGITPKHTSIRGGTDGSDLSYKGVPTMNLFAGGRNFHSVYEWVPLDDMIAAVECGIQLTIVWAEAA